MIKVNKMGYISKNGLEVKVMKKWIRTIIFILIMILIFNYKGILIRLSVNNYLKKNDINGYSIFYIEKFLAQDGYLIHLKNNLGQERNITVISKLLPLNVIHDSMLGKEDMK